MISGAALSIRCTPSTRPLRAFSTSLIIDCCELPPKRFSNETNRLISVRMRSGFPASSMACASVMPTTPMAGSQNTAVGTMSKSARSPRLPNRRSATQRPCAMATGVRCRFSAMQSPTAYSARSELRNWRSTRMPPFSPSSMPMSSSPSPSTLACRPIAASTACARTVWVRPGLPSCV
ncbi:hypothetical protein D3C81_1565810 [compost metagenome]